MNSELKSQYEVLFKTSKDKNAELAVLQLISESELYNYQEVLNSNIIDEVSFQ